tara:strand:- start:324 stop:503 length:180 start_codon:yes stop_codon:yes gene_type:complete
VSQPRTFLGTLAIVIVDEGRSFEVEVRSAGRARCERRSAARPERMGSPMIKELGGKAGV